MRIWFPFLEVALIILLCAFASSTIASVGWIGEPYHVAIAVVDDPQYSNTINWGTGLLGILPILVGLGFCIVGYVKLEKTPIKNPTCLFLLALSFFFILWGVNGIRVVDRDYTEAIYSAHRFNNDSQVDHAIQMIYTTFRAVYSLWIITGITSIIGFGWMTLFREVSTNTQPTEPKSEQAPLDRLVTYGRIASHKTQF